MGGNVTVPPSPLREVSMTAPVPRRSFLGRLAASAAALGLTSSVPSVASAASSLSTNELDDWIATHKGTEKIIYDSISGAGGLDALLFARNFVKFSSEKLG